MIKRLILLICITLPCVCLAKGLTNKQIEAFEVGGVKLGMTENQALKALTNKYNVSENQIKVIKNSNVTRILNLKINTDQEINVELEEDVSVSPPSPVVDKIRYSVSKTPDNKKQLLESAIKRYGKPSIGGDDPSGWSQWCQLTPKISSIALTACESNAAIFQVWDGSIFLSTNKYKKAIEKYQQDQRKTSPNF